jgi:hypothetical protein
MMKFAYLTAISMALLCNIISAQQDEIKTNFMFWSRLTMGQIVSSTYEEGVYDIPFDREWLETFDGGMKVIRVLSPSLTGRLNFGVQVNAATVNPKYLTNEYTVKKVSPILLDATLEYKHGGLLLQNDTFSVEFGYFPFKYNNQSTNLGEYIFRSGTYPGWLISGFEHSVDKPKLAGTHFSYSFGNDFRLRQDLIANTELDMFPYRDINLTYIITPAFRRLVDFGFGVEFARLISVDPRKTTSGLNPSQKYDPKTGYVRLTESGDTIYEMYTFKGTKLMGRFSLDFKEFFGGGAPFFGKEDLKLYSEAAILGVKNYKGWYENRSERIPVMAGFNWPTNQLVSYTVIPGAMAYLLEPKESRRNLKTAAFGAAGVVTGVGTWLMDRFLHTNSKFDVISIEVEYYPTPYVNSQENIWKGTSAVPYNRVGFKYENWNDSMGVSNDDFRWSIYASKKIGTHFRLSAQAACDHTPKNWYTPWPAPQSAKYTDMVPKTVNWYFMLRSSVYF